MPDGTDTTQMTSGAGIFFDGRTSARHDARVRLGAEALGVEGADGRPLAQWRYDDIQELSAPAGVLRLGRRDTNTLERLEITDAAFAAAIDVRAIHVDRTGALQRRQRASIVGWTVAATASLVAVAYFGVPALADRLAPLVPVLAERKLGDAIDVQVRARLDNRHLGAGFACGTTSKERAGRAALDKMMHRLSDAAQLRMPLTATVVRRSEANAITLPGARIYVFEGLIKAATNPDELAGVIAHEIGHVAHRDGTKSVLQAGGLSLLFGMLLGDFIGGGAVVVVAKTVLQSSYSRVQETAADAYGAELMNKAGGNARALGTMLAKIGKASQRGMPILHGHPATSARIAAIDRLAGPRPDRPFLAAADWAALQHICTR